MDPMNTLLNLYTGVDINSDLSISFSVIFSKEKSFWETFVKIIKRFWETNKKADTTETSEQKKEIKPELFLEVGIAIHSKDQYMIETMKGNVKSAFSTFVEGGSVSFVKKKKMKHLPMTYNQFVNFFHIPTLANFVK